MNRFKTLSVGLTDICLPCRFRWKDRKELKVDEILPVNHPLLEQFRLIAFHQLKAPIKVRFDPAIDVDQTGRQHASLLLETLVDRLCITILESFDHHEQHEQLPHVATRFQ